MGVLLGFAIGYYLGTRDGARSVEELLDSWREITATDEFRALRTNVVAMARATLAELGNSRQQAQRNDMMRVVVEGGVTALARRLAA